MKALLTALLDPHLSNISHAATSLNTENREGDHHQMSELIPHSQNNTSYFTVPKHVSSRKQLHHDRHSLSHRHNTSQVMFTKFRINRQRNDINDTRLMKGKHQGKIGYDNKTTGRIQSHLMVLVTQKQRFCISVTARNTFITVKRMLRDRGDLQVQAWRLMCLPTMHTAHFSALQ